MFEVRQEAIVRQPVEHAWRLLTQFEDYPQWTSTVQFEGEAKVGSAIYYVIFYKSSDGVAHALKFAARISTFIPFKLMEWRSGIPFLMNLSFGWHFSNTEDSLVFRQNFVGRGPLANVGARKLQAIVGSAFSEFRRDVHTELRHATRRSTVAAQSKTLSPPAAGGDPLP
jgi:hypothetical protein